MKPLILYYSRSGNTEKIALQAQETLKCKVIKIVPEEAYPLFQILPKKWWFSP